MGRESETLRPSSAVLALSARVWRGDGPVAAAARAALVPAEILFRTGARARNVLYDRGALRSTRLTVPVVSVGNLAVGGAGKTPFTRHTVERLLRRGAKPAILHGGYGEDEPALHGHWLPEAMVISGRDRVASGRRAIAAGADTIVLDDAFQHRRLARDLDIVLVSAESLENPVRLLPRGPWREPLTSLARADLVVITRRTASASAARSAAKRLHPFTAAPVVLAWLRAGTWRDRQGASVDAPAGEAFAVTAIADPGAFLANARNAGALVRDGISFPDHHTFTARDVTRITAEAGDRTLVVTEKDAVKLEPLLPDTDMRVLLQHVEIEDGETVLEGALDALA